MDVWRRINFPILLISFTLSLILWSYVKLLNQPETVLSGSFTLPVANPSIPPGYALVGTLPQTVTFTAYGPHEERVKIDPSRLKAYVDLTRPTKDGVYVVRLEAPPEYSVTWQPLQVATTVKLEKEVTEMRPVNVETIGTFNLQDFRYDGATAEPSTVAVTGASSLVEKVKRVRAYLNFSDLSERSSTRSTKLEAVDKNNLAVEEVHLSTDSVTIRAILTPRPPRRSLLIQPTWQGTPEFGSTISQYVFTPSQVSVEGPADLVANLSTIYTKPINIEKLNQTTTMPVELDLPPGTRLTHPETITVKIFVKSSGPSQGPPGNP